MKRRSAEGELPFLERPDEVWESMGIRRPPEVMRMLIGFAGGLLADRGLLRADELARLEQIADGREVHRIQADSAARILGRGDQT